MKEEKEDVIIEEIDGTQEPEINENKEEYTDQIVVDDEIPVYDDAEMPEPETKDYRQMLRLKPKFLELFYLCTGNMKYATSLTASDGGSIKLIDLVEYVEGNKDKIASEEMDIVLRFLASAEFKYVRPLMSLVEKGRQDELWEKLD